MTAEACLFVASSYTRRRRQLLRGMLWPASVRCNGAPLSEMKMKADLAARFSTRSARHSSPSSRKLTSVTICRADSTDQRNTF